MPISYSDALLRHDRSKAFGDPRDFQTFASDMEHLHPGEGFGDAAKRDGWWTRASTRADQYVFDPVSEYTTKPLGGAIGELFGHRDIGEAVGKGLLRSLVETAPLYLIPGAGPVATAAKLASVGGLMAAHTYADTGSPAAAAISGAAGALTPGFGRVFGNLGAKAAGGTRLTGTLGGRLFDEVIPEAAKDYAKVTTGRLVGSQFGMLIPSSGANLAQQRLLNPNESIDWEKFGVETAISQIPFTVFDIVKTATAPRTTAATIRPLLDKPAPKVAEFVPPPGSAEEQAQMEAAFAQLENVVSNEASTPQEREAALAAVLHTTNDPKAVIGLKNRTLVAEEPVTITGLGRKQTNGNWKVLVQDVQTATQLGVEPGQTVFVNGAEPTATEDGRMSFAVTPRQVNKNVSSPLKPEHFGFVEDPNQPKLPDQPIEWSGFSHDEVQTLRDHGVEMPPVDPMFDPVQNPQGTVAAIVEIQKRNAPLVPIAHAMEETTGKLVETQQKIEAVLTRAEEIPDVIGDVEIAKPKITSLVDNGSTPTQAVEKVRLQTQTPVADSLQQQRKVLKKDADKILREAGKLVSTTGEEYGAEKPQLKYGTAVRDESGENFKSRGLAEATKDADPELVDYVVRDAGVGKGFYLAKPINREVSLEGTVGHSLEQVLAEPIGRVDERPDVSLQDSVNTISEVLKRPDILDEFLDNNDVAQSIKEAQQVRQLLSDKLAGKDIPKESLKLVSKVLKGTALWNQRLRSFSMDSEVPHDEALVQQIGVRGGGVQKALEWYVGQKDSGVLGEMTKGLLAGVKNKPMLTFNTRDGWYYDRTTNEINVPILPINQAHAVGAWGPTLAHEFAHAGTVELLTRTDPAAVQFKATLEQGLKALRESPTLPKKVRDSITQVQSWFDEYQRTGDHEKYKTRWDESDLKKEFGEWGSVLYGLVNKEELVAQMFNSHELVSLMHNTKMPKSIGKTVMQFFSNAWTRIFGGERTDADSVLGQVLSHFDNYLAGQNIAPRTLKIRPEIPAGPGFLYGLAPYNAERNILGGKHTLPKGGVVTEQVLKQIGGVTKPLTDGEIELYRTTVPEAFGKDGVNVPSLVKGLKEKGPVVEVRKLGGTQRTNEKLRLAGEAQHRLDTAGYNFSRDFEGEFQLFKGDEMVEDQADVPENIWSDFITASEARLTNEDRDWHAMPQEDNPRYSFLGPKPESNMPGYVEGLVRVPLGPPKSTKGPQPFGQHYANTPRPELADRALYAGPHFGSEDTNVLSFYRGYEETLPDGTKAFHVIEVQSDWGQQQKRIQDRIKELRDKGQEPSKKDLAMFEGEAGDHPLLKVYESLALKAAIQHAKKVGATKVILSDAETAMMTEGHDRALGNTDIGPDFVQRPISPPQEKGMRLHYDQTLPSAMEKLTGQKGERVEVGVHKGAMGEMPGNFGGGGRIVDERNVQGSPVFRDSSGNPKTQITGRVYDVSKVPDELPLVDASGRVPEHIIKQSQVYTGRDYLRDALISEGVRPEGLASRMATVEQVFKTGDLLHSVEGFEREGNNGLLPATAEIGKATPEIRDALAKLPADVGTATMNLLADDVPTHQELWNRINEDVTIAKDLYINIKKGLVPGKLPEGALEKIQYAQVKLNAMKKALDKQALAIERFNDLNNFTYDGIESTLASRLTSKRLPAPPDPTGVQDVAQGLMGFSEIRQKTSEEELHGVNQVGPITRNLMLTQHVKKLFPSFAPVANHVREHVGRAIERITTLNLVYAWDYNTKSFSKSVAKSNMRVAQNERLTTASSNIKRFANMKEAGGTEWNWSDPEVQKELSKFNGPDRDAIKLEFDSERARHQVWTEQTLPQSLTQINKENTAKVIAAFNPGMLPDAARELSQQVYDAVAMFSDPAQSVVAVQMMQELGTKMQPHVLKAALTHAQGSIADVNKHLEFMRSRPSYVSEQRYDAHHLVMIGADGKQFRVSRKTKEELVDIQSREEAKGAKFVEYVPKSDANTPAGGVNGAVLDSMRELDVQSYNRVKIALEGVDPQVAATILSETQRTAQYESSANAFKPVPGVIRRFVAGREYINMIENAHEFYVRGNNWLRHRLTDATTFLDMMHPEVAGNRTLKKFAEQHVQNSLTPDNPFFRKLVEATYFQRLAFSLGNSALEGVQNLTTGMQAVISETGSVGDAFRLWGGAVKQLMQTRLSNNWGDPDLQWAMDKAARLGARGMAHWNDIIDPDRDTVFTINQQRMSAPAKGFQALQYGARKWATQFQRYNDNIGIITGFRLGLEKGMSKEQAFDFAWDLKERGYYSGGKAQRPVGLWSIKTKPVPQMLSSLQTYTLGWFSQMATDWKVGFGGHAPGEFSQLQRQGAKKAFLYGLGSQAVLAGALGLPGVGQGMSLLKQATGLDLKGQLRGTLAQLFGEDQENGGLLTNLALRGGLAGVSPIDPSNRAAVSFPFVGIDPYKGFDLSSLFGAPGATVSDSVQGLLAAGRGDFVGFQKLLPSVLKPTMGLIQGEGDVRDRRGTLLQTLSPAERFMTAIGLPSSRIQSARDTAEAVKNLNDAAQQQHQRFVDQLAEKVRTGRLPEVQQDLLRHKQENPEVDLRQLVRSISGRVEAQTVPYDYRRDLNVAADLHGFGSRMPSTEVERLKLRQNVEQNLGLYSRPNFREEQRASKIDTLLNSDPYQSRGRAVRQLEGLKRLRSRSNELYFPESQ